MVNTIEDLYAAVKGKKKDNTPVGENINDQYNENYTPEVINNFIQECWNLIPNIQELEEKKFKKLAFDINRALSSFNNPVEAMSNFKSLNLSESSNELFPFIDNKFYDSLKKNQIFKKTSIAGNIQVQLAASGMHNVSESQKEKLYGITAEILSGVVSKNGLSSFDPGIVNEQGRADPYLIVAVVKYIDDNFAKLEKLDAVKLNIIGLELKNAYKNAVELSSEDKVRGVFENNETKKIASAFENVDSTAISNRPIAKASFASDGFIDALQKSNKVFTTEIAENIKKQFSGTEVNEVLSTQSEELYRTTANLLVGVVTNKGVSRSMDSEIISDKGIDPNFVTAMCSYVNEHFKKLESYDEKIQRFIGGFLKEEYKKVTTREAFDIEKAIKSIDPDALASAKEAMPSGFFANLTGTSHPREAKKNIKIERQQS